MTLSGVEWVRAGAAGYSAGCFLGGAWRAKTDMLLSITFVISCGIGGARTANDSARNLATRRKLIYIPEAITLLLVPFPTPST